jgi:TonB-dependent starch-binding outer membrane protein SusC
MKSGPQRHPTLSRWMFLMAFMVLTSFCAQAQNVIKGKITDETNTGMPGVNVIVKSTTSGTTSDSDGNYSLEIPQSISDPTLVFSFIGYQTEEVIVGGRTVVDLKLTPSTETLSEVVVVGYGTQLKRDVTGAITKVDSDVLMRTASFNAIDQLKGNAAGVDIVTASAVPGGASRIRVRGNRTMTANSNNATNDARDADQLDAPLLVVDGIPYSGTLNDISPNDIASMEILKDASATAIYGSRGAGGVILITTKRGIDGKTTFNYDGYYGVSTIMGRLKVFNGEEYAEFKEQARLGNSTSPNTSGFALTAAEQAALAAGVSTDWQKLIYEDAPMTNHNLTISGGSEKSKYSLSGGYFKQGGIIPNQDFTRYTIRSSMDHQLSTRIKIGLSTLNSLSYQNTPGGAGVTSGLMRLTPLASPYNDDGTINLLPQAGSVDGAAVSPLTLLTKSESILARTRRLRTFNSLYGEVNIIEGLKYRINVGLDFSQDKQDNYSGPLTYTNTAALQSQSNGNFRNTENYQYTIENLLLYEKTFQERHKLGLTALYSIQKSHSQGQGLFGTGIPLDYMQNTNMALASSITAANPGDATDNPNFFNERGLISYMGRATYSYDGRYSLTATVRRDGSSVLSPGNQYFTYPAFGAAWNISNEGFMGSLSAISNLKLRAGWGMTASQGINPYATLGGLGTSFYNYGQGATGQQSGYTVNNLPNTTLKWQSTAQYDFGLEFGLFGNRITGSVDYYQQKTKDILLPLSLPASNGATSTTQNLGKTETKGFELTISTVNIKSPNGLTWTTDLNYFFSREEITQLTTPEQREFVANGWFVGQPLTVIYDYEKIGIWQQSDADDGTLATQTSPVQKPGQIRVLDWNTAGAKEGDPNYGVPDGRITPEDRKVIGNFQPKFNAGMTNTVMFKNFDLSVSIYARIGMKVVVPYLSSEPNGSNNNGFNFFMQSRSNQLKVDYWTPENPTNEFPRPDAGTVPQYTSTLSYVDGSFVKVRSINFGYTIPTSLLGKVGVTSLRVYASIINPFVIWSPFVDKGYGPDPEGNGFGGAVNALGTSDVVAARQAVTVNANNPSTRQFLFGVNLKF